MLAVSEYMALDLVKQDGFNLAETLQATLVGDSLKLSDLTRALVPTGGNIMWSIKTGTARPKAAETINGVLVDVFRSRAYWKVPYEESGGGGPPDCVSIDYDHGRGTPGGECAKCPLNVWGTNPKGSKGAVSSAGARQPVHAAEGKAATNAGTDSPYISRGCPAILGWAV